MMFRYIAFIWTPTNPAQHETALLLTHRLQPSASGPFRPAFDANGLRVYYATSRCDSREIHPLHDQRGVVLGDLFDRSASEHCGNDDVPQHRVEFTQDTSASIIGSEGRYLVDAYWGNYVAFLCGTRAQKKWVLRAPIGHLPCLRTVLNGVQIYFSLLSDVISLNVLRLSIDWNYVIARLASLGILGDNGLLDVFALRYGECNEIEGTQVSQRYYWDPYRVACDDVIADPSRAPAQLRQETKSCLHAWASRHETIVLPLSGGLDSSIVLSCLADAPTKPEIVCVNYYSDGPCEDERVYARAAVERAQCKLIEWRRNESVRYEDALRAPMFESARPSHRALEDCESNLLVATEHEATAICSGFGGDQLFFADSPQLTVIDYVHHRGIDSGLFKTTWEAGYAEQHLVWKIITKALYRGFIPHRWDPIHEGLSHHHLLTPKAITLARQMRTVHYPTDQYVPEGKQSHINSILHSGGFYNPLQPLQKPSHLIPLISQPIVELCLRIPTYLLTAGGWDRAIARRAFAADIPEIISKRRSKGKVSEYISNTVRNNRDFMRRILCDGILVQEGLVDRHRLLSALADHPSNAVRNHREITSTLSLEMWLRGIWPHISQRAAA